MQALTPFTSALYFLNGTDNLCGIAFEMLRA